MRNQVIKSGLWLHTTIASLAGLCLYLFPKSFGQLWPWPLPPLAAQFMASLFIGGAVCTALAALDQDPLSIEGATLLGVGYLLIAMVGILETNQTGLTGKMLIWLAAFIGMALLFLLLFLLSRQVSHLESRSRLPRDLCNYFRIHLAVVLPVGLTMYLVPALGQKLWPWGLSIVNVRLLGAFFVGASLLSFWCLRQKSWWAVQPLVGLYAVFTTLATLASLIHFSLFSPARLVTWLFFALYLFVGIGAWFFLGRGMVRNNQVTDVSLKVT